MLTRVPFQELKIANSEHCVGEVISEECKVNRNKFQLETQRLFAKNGYYM